jgi:rhamnogalacturonan endolyase
MTLRIAYLISGLFLITIFTTSVGQHMEKLDRGTVALTKGNGRVFISWRLLKEDPKNIKYDIYRLEIGKEEFKKINSDPVNTTCFMDNGAMNGGAYRYKAIPTGKDHQIEPHSAYVFVFGYERPYLSLKLKGKKRIRNVGIADLDGDGRYDYTVKYPDFNVDPYEQAGYWKRSPEPFQLEAYDADGRFMWNYNMGWAIETGVWYSPYMVFDIDQDGKAEVYTKAGEGDPRQMDGHVVDGPEYLVKIDGTTGKIIKKIPWLSRKGFERYNYWCRNFLTLAYLDGKSPSVIMQRGTYTIIKTAAYHQDLSQQWYWESTGKYESYKGQGQHSIMSADIDKDGRDELIIGSAALDEYGVPLWCTGLGHNDGGHIGDIDPDRPGLEIFYGIEKSQPKNGVCLVEALTGKIIWGYEGSTVHVHGQAMAGDIDPRYPGMECYAGEAKGGSKYFLYSSKGERLGDESFGTLNPYPVWWDADETRELVINDRLLKYPDQDILKLEGRVIFVGDIIGDWREEIITSLPGELRIYSTSEMTDTRKITLAQDRQYRLGLSRSTMGYYSPPQLGIF